jgi:virginiamycin B lyase
MTLRFVRSISLAAALSAAVLGDEVPKAPPKKMQRPPRPGIKEPGVQSPMTDLKPDAVFPVPGVPDWQVVTADAVWVSNGPKNTVHRMDAKTNQVTANITVGKKPCSGLAAGFGSIWVPNCGDASVSRVDMKTNTVVATIPVGPANSEGGIAVSEDAVWLPSDPAGKLIRVDPKKNAVAALIPVGPRPRFLTAGGGSIWTLNQGDGTVSRVDAKTNKVIATIECGIPGTGGEISYGGGFIWVTVFQIPITKIDVKTNKVVRQWTGAGGDAIRFGHGSVWLSNLREQNVWRLSPSMLR